jgi:hypothetical protein
MMNFKDYLPALAMIIPTLLLIVAAIVTLLLPANASPSDSAAKTTAVLRPSSATTWCDGGAVAEDTSAGCVAGVAIN